VTAVQSSNIAAVDYDGWGTLVIAFHNGGVYAYFHVPNSEFAGLMRASSHGKYFHAHIKGRYSYRKIAG
jgi:hypothetical protein